GAPGRGGGAGGEGAARARRGRGPRGGGARRGQPGGMGRPTLAGTACPSRTPRPAGRGALQHSMDIRAVAFDVNGTLIRIQTEDGDEQIFRSAAHFLTYQGIDLHRDQIRDLYFQAMKEQLGAGPEEYPEFDAVGIWRGVIDAHMTDFTRALPPGKLGQMPLFLAEMSRGIARRRLSLYPFVREVLDGLRGR